MTNREFANYVNLYNKFNKADRDIICFELNKLLYAYECKKVPKALCKPYKECAKRGGVESVIIKLNKADKVELVKNTKKCICLGHIDLLNNGEKNKGDALEKLICKMNNIEWTGHNSVPFYKDGDVTINGIKCQLKFIKTRARLAYVSTLKKLAEC